MSKPRFVLLDRDGTIIAEKNYLADPAGVELLPGAADGIRMLQEAGLVLIGITNQSGIGRGYFNEADMHAVHARMNELLAEHGAALDGILFCPHAPDADCDCRKPKTGMIEQAAKDYGCEAATSVMVGDKPCDIDLGKNAGARTILVRTGYGQEHEAENTCAPDAVADDLREAAQIILAMQ